MALKRFQVTIGAAATQVTATRTPCRHAIIEADDGNSNAAFVGTSDVTSANGIRLNNSATAPGRMEIGPFSGDAPFNLSEVYVAGTLNETVNVLAVTH